MTSTMLKRVLSLLLAVVLAFGMTLPAMAEEEENTSYEGISNPRIMKDSSMTAGQKTTWDCIYFGSYPQAEVVDSEEYGAIGSAYLEDGDIIVDSDLYDQLEDATWDADNTATIDGNKYYRMQESDATNSDYYDWSTSTATYRYFKYEPIKWRVLSVDSNGTALLLADKALDEQQYNTEDTDVTWKTSTIRTWLNSTFLDRAFSSSEQGAIISTTVVNNDNNCYRTDGGDKTEDQIFLLAESDVYTDDDYNVSYGGNAQAYGFAALYSTEDEARRCKSTTFAKAMGTWWNTDLSYAGNCCWWLRSPGNSTDYAAYVGDYSFVDQYGGDVRNYCHYGCRPALKINLSSSNLWSYAGTVCSDGTTGCSHPVCVYEIRNASAATTSKDGYTGDVYCQYCGTFLEEGSTVARIKTISLSDTAYTYNGKVKTPSVTVKDTAGKTISSANYTVTKASGRKNVGKYTYTIKFKGNYSGTSTLSFTINPKGTTISKVTASSKGFTVKWKKQSAQTTGYQIRYSTSSKMTKAKTVTITKNSTTSKKITKLKAKKKYYVQVRTYKTVSGKKYYSSWSKAKAVTTKK